MDIQKGDKINAYLVEWHEDAQDPFKSQYLHFGQHIELDGAVEFISAQVTGIAVLAYLLF